MKLSKSLIKEIYHSEDRNISELIRHINQEDIYTRFLLYFLFPGNGIENNFLCETAGDLTSFLIKNEFEIVLSVKHNFHNIKSFELLLDFYLSLEDKYEDLYDVTPNFFQYLIVNLSDNFKIEQIEKRFKISKISLKILESLEKYEKDNIYGDFYSLLKIKKNNMYSITCINTDRVCKYILESKDNFVNNFYYVLIEAVPELLTYKPIICKDRMIYFNDPSKIPLENNYMLTYSKAISSIYRTRILSSNIPQSIKEPVSINVDVLTKTILIERYFKEKGCDKNFCRRVLTQFIMETPSLVKVLVLRRFDTKFIPCIVKNVPPFKIAFHYALIALRELKSDLFYETLLVSILEKYPDKENVERTLNFEKNLSNDIKNIVFSIKEKYGEMKSFYEV